MISALLDIAGFVTATVGFIYGTRVAWLCGKRCQFSESLENKLGTLVRSIPVSALIYLLAFLILYSALLDNLLTLFVASITSSIVLATTVVSVAMPEFKRLPAKSRLLVQVQLKDGTLCQMDKRALNASIEAGVIARFKRASGWVEVDSDKLRGSSENTYYAGVDRRDLV